MAKVAKARRIAATTLGDVRRKEARARDLLRESAYMGELNERDRALVYRLVLGVTATSGMLDACINSHLAKPKLEPKVRDVLRLGTYELLFLSTPTPVVVSQTVELVRTASRRAAGLANAVLRRVAEQDLPARAEALSHMGDNEATVRDLTLVSGYPTWLLELVNDERGHAVVCDIARSTLEPAPIYVAPNSARVSSEQARVLLDRAGLDPQPTALEDAYALGRPAGLAASGLIGSVDVVASDLSAQRIVQSIDLTEGTRLLEIGQGRGTKSILIQNGTQRQGVSIDHIAIDVEDFKVRISQQRMEKAGLSHKVQCMAYDACKLAQDDLPHELAGGFDVVFVDAPCAGVGTMRRHPEIAWSLQPDDLCTITDMQKRILVAAAHCVAAGGSLYYSTCSILCTENEDVVRWFLSSEKGTAYELASEPFQSFPQQGGPDGHFCAHLVRLAE